jgi:hypothetical protein
MAIFYQSNELLMNNNLRANHKLVPKIVGVRQFGL